MAQLKAGRQQLAEAVKSGKGEAEIERLSNQQGVLMGQLTAIRAKAMEKGYALLTPEQRQKAGQLRDHFQQMFHNRAGRNNG
jgi:Spy/CpxP family protein refolding chaperone